VSGVPWLIIMGSGLNDWIYWAPSVAITLSYNQWEQLAINDCLTLAPFLTGQRPSSLLCDWLGSDLRIGHFFSFRCPLVNTPQLNTQLSYECRLIELSWTELYSPFETSRRVEYRSLFRPVRPLLHLFVAVGTCLPNRCLAMDYFAFNYCNRNVCYFHGVPLSSNGQFRLSGVMSQYIDVSWLHFIQIFKEILWSVYCTIEAKIVWGGRKPWNPSSRPPDLEPSSCHGLAFQEYTVTILWNVTINGFWIDRRIYWTLWYSAWLHFTVHCYTQTAVAW
jgi:hypothetical protein